MAKKFSLPHLHNAEDCIECEDGIKEENLNMCILYTWPGCGGSIPLTKIQEQWGEAEAHGDEE